MRNFQEIFEEVKQWQLKTFRYATPQSAATHLKREAKELFDDPYDEEEMADIFLLLVAVAHLTGTDLEAAIEKKMQINYARQWQEPDAEGVVEHVKEKEFLGGVPVYSVDKPTEFIQVENTEPEVIAPTQEDPDGKRFFPVKVNWMREEK